MQANSVAVGEIPKKRKANKNKELKSKLGNAESDKRIKPNIEEEEETEKTEETEETETSKQSSRASDCVHVRARPGQATDSHSLAERVRINSRDSIIWPLLIKILTKILYGQARREKISERMKYLQNLVPGCNKIAGKAGMLDEIINYVQSLQQQVEVIVHFKLNSRTITWKFWKFLSFRSISSSSYPWSWPLRIWDSISSMWMTLCVNRWERDNHSDKKRTKIWIFSWKLYVLQVFPATEISPETATSSSYFNNQLGISSSSVTDPQTPLISSASVTVISCFNFFSLFQILCFF